MHTLTIGHTPNPPAISEHSTFGGAHRALLRHAITGDYYLRPTQTTTAHTCYELLSLADLNDPAPARHPRVSGTAVIEQHTAPPLPVPAPYFTACEAHRWLDDHTLAIASPADPGDILAAARAEARGTQTVGTTLPHAAQLAGIDSLDMPTPHLIEAVRHRATVATNSHHPAAVAAAVTDVLLPETTDQQVAALIWYYVLIAWGAHAS
ncbi:hypothetical protein P5V34_04785 [Mycobacteroides abscessus subsp. abscessus]|jgi:hypothetical protein|uniref:hypothetical protein n=1 Tax=Mycobacteroides abscessus TaxID=36809 RepID=UPI00266C16A8|nr:hypothetical protein [Mycobacteroides abscessus]MDO3013303.1 hypothetical protein [Mycobacteroides abscessus subsp. abscessus]